MSVFLDTYAAQVQQRPAVHFAYCEGSRSPPSQPSIKLTRRNQYGPTIDEYFADDAYYLSPIHVTKGKKNIENVFALHQVFRTDAKLTDVQWNEQ